jgi:two-component system chemotaxis response regulator CheY
MEAHRGPGTQDPTVLLVDDDPAFLRDMTDLLETFVPDIHVVTAGDGRKGLQVLEANGVDLVISDRNMPEMDGLTFLRHVSAAYPHLPRILVTGQPQFEPGTDVKACEVIAKPPVPTKTVETVRRLLALSPTDRPCGKTA